jgi:hypothetical protein
MQCSTNTVVRECFHRAACNARSIIGNTLAFYRDKYGLDIGEHSLNNAIKRVHTCSQITEQQQCRVSHMRNLINAKADQNSVAGFDRCEINDMLEYIAID